MLIQFSLKTTPYCETHPSFSFPIITQNWFSGLCNNNKWSLHWRHNEHDGVSNHQPSNCLLNSLFRRRSKKTSKLRITGLCARNSPGTGEFPAQMPSNAENVSIWWRHHGESDTDRTLWLVADAILRVTRHIFRSDCSGGHGMNFLTAVTYSSQSNWKLYLQKDNYVRISPVELCQCNGALPLTQCPLGHVAVNL